MSNNILHSCRDITVRGSCSPGFSAMLNAFVENFDSGDELGAGVCVYQDGDKIVELYGGYTDQTRTKQWMDDTLVVTYSASKAPLYVLALMLAHEGAIDFDAPIASYWPEFSANSKGNITLRHVLNHTAGLAAVEVPQDSAVDWSVMIAALQSAAPSSAAGKHPVYHSLTQGWLLAETFTRATGKSFVDLYVEKLQQPLSLDFHYGLNDSQISRCADYSYVPEPGYYYEKVREKGSIQAIALSPLGETMDLNSDSLRRAVIPAVNGHASAKALARLFAPLAGNGTFRKKRYFHKDVIDAMTKLQWEGEEDMVGNFHFRMGMGFLLNGPPVVDLGPNETSFGALGSGGILCFADRKARLSYGYVCSSGFSGLGTGPRNKMIIDALYDCL